MLQKMGNGRANSPTARGTDGVVAVVVDRPTIPTPSLPLSPPDDI